VQDQRSEHDRHERLRHEHDWRNKDRRPFLERSHLGHETDDRG